MFYPRNFSIGIWMIWVVLACSGCFNQDAPSVTNPPTAPNKFDPSHCIALFYTGELLGELEPCGCSGSKLGGMLLRSSWIRELQKEYQTFYLIDGGFASPQWDLQDRLKFIIYRRMLDKLGDHLQFLGSRESPPSQVDTPLFLGTATGRDWYKVKTFSAATTSAKVLFLALEKGKSRTLEEVGKLIQEHNPSLVFALVKGMAGNYQGLVPDTNVLTLLLPVDAPAPFSPMKIATKTFVTSAGNRGRYAGLIVLKTQDGQVSDWENRIISLEKKYAIDQAMIQILEEYKQDLKDKRLLELQIKRSSPIGYVGSDSCMSCHPYEYAQWKTKPHSQAFQTLVKENHHYDPECVGCHVVGYEFEEGFRTEEETPHLIDVGCETCHGPGARHMVNSNAPGYGKCDGDKTCLVCHEKDRSPDFEYTKFLEKIKHWKDEDQ